MPGSADTVRESEQDAGLRSGGTAEGREGVVLTWKGGPWTAQ